MYQAIQRNIEEVKRLCQLHKVDSLSLFGSTATGKGHENSDIDFLVRFSNSIPLLDIADHYFGLHDDLTQLLQREVDLVVEKSIKNPILKEEIERTKVAIL